jgi:hypothetical protein
MKRFPLLATLALATIALAGCSSTGLGASGGSAGGGTDGSTTSWYTDTYPDFKTISFSGKSDDVIKVPGKAGIVTASYTGSSNFSIAGIDDGNKSTTDLLVNTIGSYKGVSAYGMHEIGNPVAKLKVSGKGKWKITITSLTNARALPSSGRGDGVYKYDGKATTWKITNKGSANFAILQNSSSPMPNLAVNDIGNYSGKVAADAGPSIVIVTSNGKWTIK